MSDPSRPPASPSERANPRDPIASLLKYLGHLPGCRAGLPSKYDVECTCGKQKAMEQVRIDIFKVRAAVEDSDILRHRGIVEIAAANESGSVEEYMRHWEGRAIRAEVELEKLRAADAPRAHPSETDADGEEWENPQRTLDILARMLGWMNTPPRRVFEQEINALKYRVAVSRPHPETPSATK